METAEILARFDRQQRQGLEIPGTVREVVGPVVRILRPAPGMNFIPYSRLTAENADAVIAEQVAYLRALGQPFEWQVYEHDPPPDLLRRLAAQGFEEGDWEPLLVLDVEAAPEALLKPVTADVRRLTRRAELEEVIRVEEQVWGGDFGWMRQRMGAHLERPGYLSVYAAYVGGDPASVGWTYFHLASEFAGLFGGSTVRAQRGRGLYTALLAARVQEARRRGVRFLLIEPTAMSEPIVRKYGFRLLARSKACEWRVSGA
jgi:GNAT superfamily N-acetyltransferase